MEDHCQPLVDIVVEDADTSEADKSNQNQIKINFIIVMFLAYMDGSKAQVG